MLGALAQPTRLKVVSALARESPGGLAVGEIAAQVATPQNTMSTHLAILSRAGLVVAQRQGRVVRYSVVIDALRTLADYLADDVSSGRA